MNSRNIFFTEGWWQRKLSEFQFYSNAELEGKPNAGELVLRDGDLVYSEINRAKQRIALASIVASQNKATFYGLESGDDEFNDDYPSLYKPFPLTDAEKTQLNRYITQIIPFGLS